MRGVRRILVVSGLTASICSADGFSLGVAAGDPTPSGVVLWTRADAAGPVRVDVASDDAFSDVVLSRSVMADPASDQTVKVIVDDLASNRLYYYRFVYLSDQASASVTGRFRTAPATDESADLRLIFTGDSNYRFAPFGVLASAARESADVFVWYGDTIYADVSAGGLGVARTLNEYRAKYRQVRSDPNVQALLARQALIVGWDDHEVRNDYAGTDPSLSQAQRDAAYRAFFEYMPIRETGPAEDRFRTYRQMSWGAAVELFVLDGRQYRDVSAEAACGAALDPLGFALPLGGASGDCRDELAAPRTMLGAVQREWLLSGLRSSNATTKLVVNAVPLSFFGIQPYDRWDGYDHERRTLLEAIDAERLTGVVFLTTDIHASALNPDVGAYFRANRDDYGLSGGVRVSEVIVGPMGNETFSQTLADLTASLAQRGISRALLDPFAEQLLARVAQENELAFFETNRVSYVVIDATIAGNLEVRYAGLPPEQAQAATVAAAEFFRGSLRVAEAAAPAPVPCGLPVLLAGWLGTCLAWWRAAARRR